MQGLSLRKSCSNIFGRYIGISNKLSGVHSFKTDFMNSALVLQYQGILVNFLNQTSLVTLPHTLPSPQSYGIKYFPSPCGSAR